MQNFSLNDKADKPEEIKKDPVDIKVSGVFERMRPPSLKPI